MQMSSGYTAPVFGSSNKMHFILFPVMQMLSACPSGVGQKLRRRLRRMAVCREPRSAVWLMECFCRSKFRGGKGKKKKNVDVIKIL